MSLQSILEALSGKHTAGTGLAYSGTSLYRWVLENGLPFSSRRLTKREWELVDKTVWYHMPCQCFANCQQSILGPLLLQMTDIARGRVGVISPFDYVEGYVISPDVPIPIHHAWLLLRGKVIDPTLRARKKSRRRKFPGLAMGVFPDEREYYGSVIPWREVAACTVRNKAWHTVLDDYKHGYPLLQEREGSGTREPRRSSP